MYTFIKNSEEKLCTVEQCTGYGIIEIMEHVGDLLKEKNIILETHDPVVAGGFTQVPNFILKNEKLTVGEKMTFAMFLSYAWHNDSCFPGQDKLAKDIGAGVRSVNRFIKGLARKGFLTIQRRGLGKTNIYTLRYQVTHQKAYVHK